MLPSNTLDAKTKTILIVDDTPANLKVAVSYLENHGFDVVVAQNSEECLTRAQFVKPDIILLDVLMPGVSGIEICKRLKSIDKTKNIPVIFMTALGDVEHKLAGFAAGGIDYVTKPFQIEEVLARINTYLALHTAQQQLAYSEQRFHDLATSASDWFWETDDELRLTYLSENFSGDRSTADSIAHALGKRWWELNYACTTERTWESNRALFDKRLPFKDMLLQHTNNNGEAVFLSLSGRPLLHDDGRFGGYRGTGRDISDQMRANQIIRESEARFRDLIELSSDWYWELDTSYRFTLLAGDVAAKADFDPSEASAKPLWEVEGLSLCDMEWDEFREILDKQARFSDIVYVTDRSSNGKHYVSISGKPMLDQDKKFRGYRGVGQDITERKRYEEKIQHIAYHDSLTQLPNRLLFGKLLSHSIAQGRRYKKKLAVFFLDLDRFKNINDTLGHDAGDLCLQQVSRVLKDCLRKSDVVARLGGDEFVVLMEEITDINHVTTLAMKILSSIIKPFTLHDQELRVTTSIGISIYPMDGQDEQTLMKNADIALYRAKEEGKNNFRLYSDQMNDYSIRRLALESDLRRALEKNEFLLHYQPKIDFRTGKISGMEALIRWQHPDLGMVPPGQFIPIAEETGMIIPIGRWVLKTACEQNKAWQSEGLPMLRVSVNLSAQQFSDANLLQDISTVLLETGLSADFLELEITESMVMRNPEKAVLLLNALKEMGICLTMDDFGVGYSSLATIKKFPIDIIKIDQSFIRGIAEDKGDKALTEAIIVMSKTLNLKVVAEGVETLEQHNFLMEKACDEFQGYYFSKPLDNEKFFDLLREHSRKFTTVND